MESKFIQDVIKAYNFENEHEMLFELIPRDYNTPALFADLDQVQGLPDKMNVTLFGYIDKFDKSILSGRKSLTTVKAKLYKDGVSVNLRWTTSTQKAKAMIYGLSMNAPKDTLVQVSGKVKSFDGYGSQPYKFIEAPKLSKISEQAGNAAVLIPEPIYKLKSDSKLKSTQVQHAFRDLFKNFDQLDKTGYLPGDLEQMLKLGDLKTAIQYMHGLIPIKMSLFQRFMESQKLRRRVLVEKIWRIMKSSHESLKNSENSANNTRYSDQEALKVVTSTLEGIPFTLTGDQKKAIWGVLKLFTKKNMSKSLIFGDVGSGKTMVSLVVANVLRNLGEQVVIMAPTSILAKQHFREAKEILGEDAAIEIVHSKTTKKEKTRIQKVIDKGEGIILYGTSSLNGLEYENLTTVFIDEEQKFGVHDKEVLQKRYGTHTLFMTATPIPRTLASSVYSDFSVFKIEEKPALQKPRITKILDNIPSPEELSYIKEKLSSGEQALIVVPAISSKDIMSSKTAEEKYGNLFAQFTIDKINGSMKAPAIEKTTEKFMNGEIDILIATTMVDSGFSNKNLSFVFIEGADRFGIAQMHQIRGRVGRAEKQGYCYLVPTGTFMKDKTKDRLESLVESENGFELSKKDIRLRGSGDLLGVEQSGSEMNLLEWEKEIKIMNKYLRELSL